MHRSAAWALVWAYAALVVYASLYPFEGWRDQGVPFYQFLLTPWLPYWSGFDVVSNLLGYVPLGFLLTFALLRSRGGVPSRPRLRDHPLVWACLAFVLASLLSLGLEALQTYLPARVPSKLDALLNAAGAMLGAGLLAALARMGVLDLWTRFRSQWFVPDASGAVVLLALWPWALLYPAAVPLGLGQVFERLQQALNEWLQAWGDWSGWVWQLPWQPTVFRDLLPSTEALSVALGLLVPILLGLSTMPAQLPRRWLAALLLLGGTAATTLSAVLSYGPSHVWAWITPQAIVGLAVGWAISLGLIAWGISARRSEVLMLLALAAQLSLINLAPTSAYFAQTLQAWEQGRFIRFYGVGQWLAWLWPYAVLWVAARRWWRRLSGQHA